MTMPVRPVRLALALSCLLGAALLGGCTSGGPDTPSPSPTPSPASNTTAPPPSLPSFAERPSSAPVPATAGASAAASGPVRYQALPPWNGSGPWARMEAKLQGDAGAHAFLVQALPTLPKGRPVAYDVVLQVAVANHSAPGFLTWSLPVLVESTSDGRRALPLPPYATEVAAGQPLHLTETWSGYLYETEDNSYPMFLGTIGATRGWEAFLSVTLRLPGSTVGPSSIHGAAGGLYNHTVWMPESNMVTQGQTTSLKLDAGAPGFSHVALWTTGVVGADLLASSDACTLTWADGRSASYGGTGPLTTLTASRLDDGAGTLGLDCTWTGVSHRHDVVVAHFPIPPGALPAGVRFP